MRSTSEYCCGSSQRFTAHSDWVPRPEQYVAHINMPMIIDLFHHFKTFAVGSYGVFAYELRPRRKVYAASSSFAFASVLRVTSLPPEQAGQFL